MRPPVTISTCSVLLQTRDKHRAEEKTCLHARDLFHELHSGAGENLNNEKPQGVGAGWRECVLVAEVHEERDFVHVDQIEGAVVGLQNPLCDLWIREGEFRRILCLILYFEDL